MNAAARYRLLTTALRWLAVVLILRVLVTILSNYPDYFPPDFESLFLQGREATFSGVYPPAFYIHIFSAPAVLLTGLFLLSETVRVNHGGLHRVLGRVHVVVLLVLVLPSSAVLARHAFGGWAAGLSFMLLSLATAGCAIVGVFLRTPTAVPPASLLDAPLVRPDLLGRDPSLTVGRGGAGRSVES